MTRFFGRSGALATVFGLLACGQDPRAVPYPDTSTEPGGELVAKIGSVRLTTGELEKRIAQMSPFIRQRFSDPTHRQNFAKNEARFELLAQEGWQRGLHADPQIVAELKRSIVDRLVRDETRRLTEGLEITETELRNAYLARKDEYNQPERVRLSQIVRMAKSDAERVKAHTQLEEVRQKVLASEKRNETGAFEAMAKETSEEPEAAKSGGDLSFLSRAEIVERLGENVASAAFDSLSVGDMVVADAPNASVLFKKTGRRRAVEKSLEMVKAQLRTQLLQDKRNAAFEQFMTELEQKAEVRIDSGALEKLKIDLESPARTAQ